MCEIWKPIKNYKKYFVSNFGKVKSFKKYKDGIILKPYEEKIGYLSLSLSNNNGRKTFRIHNLVAVNFIQNPDPQNLIQVNHIDEDKSNNHFGNLEWSSAQYNTEYSQSKKYKILFPDGHEEIIFNLSKFCKENNLNRGNVNNP